MGWPHNHSYRNNINTINWIKDRLKNVNIKHIVYVGLVSKHRFRLPSCFWWLELLDLYSLSKDDVIIEADEATYNELKKENEFNNLTLCDVAYQEFGLYKGYVPPPNSLLLFSHGPEHIMEWHFKFVAMPAWKNIYEAMLFTAPWGRWDQDAIRGNFYQEHKWLIDVNDFTELGFDTFTYGPKNKYGEIAAVWSK